MRNASLGKSIAVAVPAIGGILIAVLAEDDFRASGAMSLFAFGPGILAALLLLKRPWRMEGRKRKAIGLGGAALSVFFFVFFTAGGAPEFLEARYGWFVGLNDYGPRAVISTPAGFLVVGDDSRSNAIVLTSTNGIDWQRVTHTEAFERLDVGDVIWDRHGMVMAAHDDSRGPFLSLSSTDGQSWIRESPVPVDGKPVAMAQANEILVTVGESFSNDSVFWYRDYQGQWKVADPKPIIDTDKVPVGVAALSGVFVAALNQNGDAVLFTSTDGSAWAESYRFPKTTWASIAGSGSTAILVGHDNASDRPAVWLKSDGDIWERLAFGEDLAGVEFDLVITEGNASVLFGHARDDNEVLVWELNEGHWQSIDSPFQDALIRDAVINAMTTVVVGVDRKLNAIAIWSRGPQGVWRRSAHEQSVFGVR